MTLSTSILLTIALAPLVGCLLAGFLGKFIGRAGSHSVTILGVAISCALSFYVLYQLTLGNAETYNHNIYTWFQIGHFNASVGFMVDRLTAMMLVVVSFVSLLVHLYTVGYMADDPGYKRFFSYISLFTFSMFMLVMANNFMQLFFGWEAVGLVSYLLIGFWYKRPTAIFANLKAFLVNRVGDFGFLLGIAAVLFFSHSLDYQTVFDGAGSNIVGHVLQITAGTHWDAATVICICLFIGAMGKSAQVPLHVWLPDSMEGPTPISALIHAATMVTAGIFMVARMSPLFELSSTALSFVLVIGATTALFTGMIGIIQHDIKRVIAYSTLSQLGYMTVALGVSAYSGAVFHLMTHAFFKALLFLGAGSVIIAMHHEQDMRYMGGLRKYMPVTWITMWIGSLALCGVPFFSGFYSKDAIIEAAGLSHRWGANYAYFCVMAGVLVTGLYTFRQMFLTFHGKERFTVVADHGHDHDGDHADPSKAHGGALHAEHGATSDEHHGGHEPGVLHERPKESPWVVTVPLVLLAIPSLLVGFLTVGPILFRGWFGSAIHVDDANNVLGDMAREFHGPLSMALHGFSLIGPFGLVLLAFVIQAYIYLFNPALAGKVKSALKPLWIALDRKYWFDAVYLAVFARGGVKLGRGLWKAGDAAVIDGAMVNGSVSVIERIAAATRRLQSGYLYHYAFAMILGLILVLGGYWLLGPAHPVAAAVGQ